MMNSEKLAAHLLAVHEACVLTSLTAERCRHEPVQQELLRVAAGAPHLLTLEEAGASLEGRPIRLLRLGRGERRVLIWSQMHGDEPTGTLALVDLLRFLSGAHGKDAWVEEMLDRLSIVILPMLNPDGAERYRRETAAQIDLNRDALALATPEGRTLKTLHQQFEPDVAIHLHDQELCSVGRLPAPAALALLAPAMDEKNSLTASRLRAMSIAALLVSALQEAAEGRIATYDDSFEPRAFGDTMQAWGTSTLLIESGHWPGDPERGVVRRLTFAALLTALYAIASESYQQADLERYHALRPNGKRMFDIVVRGVQLEHPGGWTGRVDIGLIEEPAWKAAERGSAERSLIVREVGDLSTHSGLEVISGQGMALGSSVVTIERVLSRRELLEALASGRQLEDTP